MSEGTREKKDERPWVTVSQLLNCHAQFGRVDYHMTKEEWRVTAEPIGPIMEAAE